MRVLHTSDWHLGQSFMGKSREEEHQMFFTWLLGTIEARNVDVLIVAGDIFDTGTPPNYALELYYNFLTKLTATSCKSIIITAGNHDSIATLKAPKQLLEALNVHVITSGNEDENELIAIYKSDELQGVVCAVPFLRDYIVRKSMSEESLKDKEHALSLGIKEHYDKVYKEALKFCKDKKVPIIATGHLTTVGSKTSESERDIYIGGSLDIDSDFFSRFDYVALGHLHINQVVGKDRIRYSGSPIPLSFSEATSQKKVNLVEFEQKTPKIRELKIPFFRQLLVFRGNIETIIQELECIEDKNSWIEVHLQDDNPYHANQLIRQKAQELELTLLAVKTTRVEQGLSCDDIAVVSLDELTPLEVFKHRLEQDTLEDKPLKKELINCFNGVLLEVQNR